MEENEFEKKYVHDFYNFKSQKFSDSRVKAWPFTIKFIQEHVKENDLLLDAGCGNGRQFIHPNTIGVDFSENLLLDALDKPNLSLVKANVIALPFRSNTFDVVLSIAVIHHLSTPERRTNAINEIKRVLKDNGTCLLYMWHKDASNKAKFAKLQDTEYLVSWKGEIDLLRYYCLFDEEMLRKLIEESGMKILEINREQESIYAVIQKVE